MDVDVARQILSFAKERQSYDLPIPTDDEVIVSEASRLVGQAEIAWNHNRARGPEVAGVLRLANPHFDGTGIFTFNGTQPVEPEPELAQAPPGGNDDPPAKAETLQEEPQETPEPEPEAAPEPEDEDVDYEELRKHQVPWDEYDGDSVQVINNALDAALAGDGGLDANGNPILLTSEQISDLLAHVWAYESANKNRAGIIRHLETIAGLLEQADPQDDSPDHQPPPAAPERPAHAEAPQEAPEAPQTPEPDAIDYSDLIAEVEAEIARERIHTPQAPEGDPVPMPYAISQVSDKELRELHHAFGAYAYYAESRVQRHEAIAQRARQQADDIVRELLQVVAQYDERNHERRMTFITAEVESSPHVVALRGIQRRHEVFAEAARRERDSYHKNVEFLSRQESMRHNEWLRAQR